MIKQVTSFKERGIIMKILLKMANNEKLSFDEISFIATTDIIKDKEMYKKYVDNQ